MPISSPVLNPPFNIVRVSYVDLAVTDIEASKAFYVDSLGLNITEQGPGVLYLRAIEERSHHSIVLTEAPLPGARAMGFRVASEEDLDRAAAWFGRLGVRCGFVDRAYQGRTLRALDPLGMPIELHAGMDTVPSMLQRYAHHRGARIQRIDHVNCFTPDVQASHDFFAALGFRVTEYTETEDPDPRLWAIWMHRKGNVHDLAFTNGAGPRLHHVGMWTPTPLDILHICDVLATSGYLASMERGPGRHGISNAFFLYLRDPDGHRIELFTSDYLTVDPDHEPIRWTLRDPQRQTLWGHPAPKSWFEEGSVFEGTPVVPPVLEARPIVAR